LRELRRPVCGAVTARGARRRNRPAEAPPQPGRDSRNARRYLKVLCSQPSIELFNARSPDAKASLQALPSRPPPQLAIVCHSRVSPCHKNLPARLQRAQSSAQFALGHLASVRRRQLMTRQSDHVYDYRVLFAGRRCRRRESAPRQLGDRDQRATASKSPIRRHV
jgi:hypothetical protein